MMSSYSHYSDCESWVVDREFVGHGSWITVLVSPCSLCWFRRVGFAVLNRGSWIANLWVMAARFVGHQFTRIRGSRLLGSWVTNLHEFVGRGCWVHGSPIYTNSWVAVARFGEGDERDERQGWEMRDRGERVRDEGKNKGERVDKFFFFFYNTFTFQTSIFLFYSLK